MAFTLEHVAPWGRSFGEYRRMFALGEGDLQRRIIGCGDGPASFNAEATERGVDVVSVDPIYRFEAEEIRRRIDETYPKIIEQTRRNEREFVWTTIPSIELLGQTRMASMTRFLEDYGVGRTEGRYIVGELPSLPFADGSFELALCSHFLFLYSEQFDQEFHEQSLRELCRVADEVRVFPLLALGSEPSPHLDPITKNLSRRGYDLRIEHVDYEFQRGGNQMLRVAHRERRTSDRR